MNWLKIAAEVFRHVSSSGPSARSQENHPPPVVIHDADIHSVVSLLKSHRAEVEKNLQTVAQMLKAQNDQQIRDLQMQRRWNYGLTAAVVILAILAVADYLRG